MGTVIRFARGQGPNAWDTKGAYRIFMRQPAVQEAIAEIAAKIHADAGGDEAGFRLEVQAASGNRETPRAAIIAATYEAREAEAVDRVLTRAFEKNREG